MSKILWHSGPPWNATGYSKQTKLFAPRLKRLGNEVVISSSCALAGGEVDWNGIRCLPIIPGGHTYGADAVNLNTAIEKPDFTICLYDLWVFDPASIPAGGRFIPWFPVDQDPPLNKPMPKVLQDKARQSFASIVYSQFALAQCQDAGLDTLYVPHGVDTAIYKPGSKAEARRRLGWPEDNFVFGMVADNKGFPLCRKALCEHLEAFARFHAVHPDSRFYLHTYLTPTDGYNLVDVCKHFGIEDAVWAPEQNRYLTGRIGEVELADTYRAMDCLLSVTMGEGFGVPILEAQACGTPVITGDWTAMSELNFSGWTVAKEDAHPYMTNLGGYWYLPKVGAMVEQMEAAYSSSNLATSRSRRAVDMALEYDADYVTEVYWKTALEVISQKIAEQGDTPRTFAEALRAV